MDVCRLCNHPIGPGQKTWRLGTDVEHVDCGDGAPPIEVYITTLRAAVRGLNGVRSDLVRLGQEIMANHLHRKANGRPPNFDAHLRNAAERLRAVVALLAAPKSKEPKQ